MLICGPVLNPTRGMLLMSLNAASTCGKHVARGPESRHYVGGGILAMSLNPGSTLGKAFWRRTAVEVLS